MRLSTADLGGRISACNNSEIAGAAIEALAECHDEIYWLQALPPIVLASAAPTDDDVEAAERRTS